MPSRPWALLSGLPGQVCPGRSMPAKGRYFLNEGEEGPGQDALYEKYRLTSQHGPLLLTLLLVVIAACIALIVITFSYGVSEAGGQASLAGFLEEAAPTGEAVTRPRVCSTPRTSPDSRPSWGRRSWRSPCSWCCTCWCTSSAWSGGGSGPQRCSSGPAW